MVDQTHHEPDFLTVSELTGQIKDVLEGEFPQVRVSGELTDLARPKSGHIYLTLKDDNAQVRGVIWRNTVSRLGFQPEDGQHVVCDGDIDVYPPRGSYQLVIRQMQPLGEGAMQLALRQLQQRLTAEGLFDPAHKKILPAIPGRVAFVTSPTGAAIRDFLEVLRRRWPAVHVMVIPARVQGEGAADEIVRGITLANQLRPAPDVLVVGRGGGSIEDLWCFNEEPVVRAIFESGIPVVSAVGHEIDVTLSDLVADRRALTPSEAGEIVVPSRQEMLARLETVGRRLAMAVMAKLTSLRARLEELRGRRILRRPDEPLRLLARRTDDLEFRADRAVAQRLTSQRDRLAVLAGRLQSLSPLAVLGRGYSMTRSEENEHLVTTAGQLKVGDRIRTRFSSGDVVSRVEDVNAGSEADQVIKPEEE
ncbi:MAG: exodeoxyribonuclease VII large subunit [Planctomycetota bacterium]|nr:exodeoxyribonuclease VII large subunit [Planctomycetota bacterium]